MRTIPRALPALLLAFLLAPSVGAQAAEELELDAARGSMGELLVTVTSAGEFEGAIVVSHRDPLAGTVVDRVAPVDLAAGTRTVFEIRDLRAAFAQTVRLVDEDELPRFMGSVELYDGSALSLVDEIASVTVAAGSDADRYVAAQAHRASDLPWDGSIIDFRELVTSKGVLVVGYASRPEGSLALRASRDGGHTWGREHVLVEREEHAYAWAMAEAADGKVSVVFHDIEPGAATLAEPWYAYSLDPIADRLTARADAPNTIPSMGFNSLVVLRDGSALLAHHRTGYEETNVTIYRIAPGTPVTPIATLDAAQVPHMLRLASDGTRVALAYTTASPTGRVHLARSHDAGYTWGSSVELAGLAARGVDGPDVDLRSMQMGADGAVHLLATEYDAPAYDHVYARAPLSGADGARDLPDSGTPMLAVTGRRVTYTAWQEGSMRAYDSTDAGASFSAGPSLYTGLGGLEDAAHLPDGRLVLLGSTYDSGDFGVDVSLPFDPVADPAASILSTQSALLRIARLTVPSEGDGAPVVVAAANEGAAAVTAHLTILVNGVVVATTDAFVLAGTTQDIEIDINPLSAGDEVVARLTPGSSSASATVDPAVVLVTPPTHEPAPEDDGVADDEPAQNETGWTWTNEPARPTPIAVAPPNDWAVATPAPSVSPGDSPGAVSPEPTSTEAYSFWVEPAEVRVPQGGSAQVRVFFRNDDPNYDTGSETPTLRDLPEGVSWEAPPTSWRLVRPYEVASYSLTLYAGVDAPLASQTATLEARRQTDRPSFTTSLQVQVVEPTKESGMPPVGFLVAGAAAGLLGLGVLFRDWLRWLSALAIAPMYTRISKAQVLGNDVRKGIYDHVVAHPGLKLTEIASALTLSVTPTLFHLRVLEREGYVASRREWSRTLYYPTERAPAFPREGRDVASTLTRLLADNPGLAPADVAQRLGISRQLARYHLLALEKQGVIRRGADAKGYLVVVSR